MTPLVFRWEMLYPPPPRGSVQRAVSASPLPWHSGSKVGLGYRRRASAGTSSIEASTESFYSANTSSVNSLPIHRDPAAARVQWTDGVYTSLCIVVVECCGESRVLLCGLAKAMCFNCPQVSISAQQSLP